MGRLEKAWFVGANIVQGPAASKQEWVIRNRILKQGNWEELTGIVWDFPDETGKFERFEKRGESFLWVRPQGLHHVTHRWGIKNFLNHVDQPIPRLNVSLWDPGSIGSCNLEEKLECRLITWKKIRQKGTHTHMTKKQGLGR